MVRKVEIQTFLQRVQATGWHPGASVGKGVAWAPKISFQVVVRRDIFQQDWAKDPKTSKNHKVTSFAA